MAPAEGLVPVPPGSAPVVEAPAPTVSETAPPPVKATPPSASETAAPLAGPKPTSTTPELVRARAAQPVKDAPPAPEPNASGDSTSIQEPYEIGGSTERPAPLTPADPWSDEDASSTEPGKLVWGIHRPVAKWKRNGLIGSGVLTGVAIATAIGTQIEGQRRLDEIGRYLEDRDPTTGFRTYSDPITACEQNRRGGGAGAVLVDDVRLAHRCGGFNRVRITRGVSAGLSVVGLVSSVTFGILHLLHREEVPRRVEARSDGFSVRF